MLHLKKKKIFSTEPKTFNEPSSCLDHPGFEKRARSLLVVVSTAPTTNYENFTERVRLYNTKEPFFFPTPTVFKNVSYVKVRALVLAIYFC